MKYLVFMTMPFFLALKLSEIGAKGHPNVQPHKTKKQAKLERSSRRPASVDQPVYVFASCFTQNGAIINPGHHDFGSCMNNDFPATTHDIVNPSKQLGILIPFSD